MIDRALPRVICTWSGPRNVSTALMYSFAQRSDTEAVDEPLYGHYLRVSGAPHPGRDQVLTAMPLDGNGVMRRLLAEPRPRPLLFLKQMAHHLVDIDRGFLDTTENVLLVRDPREVLPSLAHQLEHPRLSDTGLSQQVELYESLAGAGRAPVVVDARALLLDPPGVLAELCRRLGIDFDPAMLSWPAGPKPCDGVWAPHWYQNVHRSTGFEPYRPKRESFPASLEPVLAECRPLYDRLLAQAIRARVAG